MEEMGYNPYSLSMKATGKPDTIRNLLEGKSKNLRADNYEAIIQVLWPNGESKECTPLSTMSEEVMGLVGAISAITSVLESKGHLKASKMVKLYMTTPFCLKLKEMS